jgi:ribosomal protein S2
MIKEKKNLYSSFDTIVLFNCNYTLPVMKEIFSLNKPIIGICNSTNKFLKYFDYILPGNTQSINSVYFYITFFYHIILKELLILYLD